ncbi:MAG TPA: hypothetical protein VF261_00190 [Candidatus Saccharimonadales bacterium]
MGHETSGAEPEDEGYKYLRLLGLENLANEPIPGTTKRVRDFLSICGDYARPMLVGFASLSPDDPSYEAVREALQTQVKQFLVPPED